MLDYEESVVAQREKERQKAAQTLAEVNRLTSEAANSSDGKDVTVLAGLTWAQHVQSLSDPSNLFAAPSAIGGRTQHEHLSTLPYPPSSIRRPLINRASEPLIGVGSRETTTETGRGRGLAGGGVMQENR